MPGIDLREGPVEAVGMGGGSSLLNCWVISGRDADGTVEVLDISDHYVFTGATPESAERIVAARDAFIDLIDREIGRRPAAAAFEKPRAGPLLSRLFGFLPESWRSTMLAGLAWRSHIVIAAVHVDLPDRAAGHRIAFWNIHPPHGEWVPLGREVDPTGQARNCPSCGRLNTVVDAGDAQGVYWCKICRCFFDERNL